MTDFPIHTGQRKRPMGKAQVEALARRSSTAQRREAARRFYAPHESWWCEKCCVEVYQIRCRHCGKSESEDG